MERNDPRLTHARTCVYNVNYHIIWGTKYRNGVLNGEIEKDLKEILLSVAKDHGFEITHLEVGLDDHVHMLARANPKLAISTIVKDLKGISAYQLFKRHPELKSRYWKANDRHLWSPSYFVETIGASNAQAVVRYIDDQRLKEKDLPK